MNLERGEVFDDLLERRRGYEAQVGGAGRGVRGVRAELVSALVELDGLDAEGEVLAAVDHDHVHAEDFGVEVDGGVDAGDGKDEMIEPVKGEGHESG